MYFLVYYKLLLYQSGTIVCPFLVLLKHKCSSAAGLLGGSTMLTYSDNHGLGETCWAALIGPTKGIAYYLLEARLAKYEPCLVSLSGPGASLGPRTV